jgi:uncharacterized protein
MTRPQALTIAVEGSRVSGLLQVPRKARVCYVLAHGAGAGMLHPFMEAIAERLAEPFDRECGRADLPVSL